MRGRNYLRFPRGLLASPPLQLLASSSPPVLSFNLQFPPPFSFTSPSHSYLPFSLSISRFPPFFSTSPSHSYLHLPYPLIKVPTPSSVSFFSSSASSCSFYSSSASSSATYSSPFLPPLFPPHTTSLQFSATKLDLSLSFAPFFSLSLIFLRHPLALA